MGRSSTLAAERQRILVVDDGEISRLLAEAILRNAAYDVDCVASGREAIAAVARDHYDLVLLDIDMPGLDGFETATAIRRNEAVAPRIAAFSSRSNQADRARAAAVGMEAHLARPIAPLQLVREVRALFAEPAPTPVWHRDVFDDLVERLGSGRMRDFLRHLADQCVALLDLVSVDNGMIDPVDRCAHDLASTSGMLGFQTLSDRCRDVLQARNGLERARFRTPLVDALEQTIAVIESHLVMPETIAA